MEYNDFLTHWEGIERTQIFDNSWVQSSHWLNVKSRPMPSAWQFGDVSCVSILSWVFIYAQTLQSHSTSLKGLIQSLYCRSRTPGTIKAFRAPLCGLLTSSYSKWAQTKYWAAPAIHMESLEA